MLVFVLLVEIDEMDARELFETTALGVVEMRGTGEAPAGLDETTVSLERTDVFKVDGGGAPGERLEVKVRV